MLSDLFFSHILETFNFKFSENLLYVVIDFVFLNDDADADAFWQNLIQKEKLI